MGSERAPAQFDRELGERLRGLREARRLSLKDVQVKSGGRIKVAALRSWECAERRIPVCKLILAAEFYGVTVASLLPGEDTVAERVPVLEEFPAEMSLTRDAWGRHVLVLEGPELHGTAVSASREVVLALAEAYAAWKRSQSAVKVA
jgi:transcriptional regulator with XRE-family HTH domain